MNANKEMVMRLRSAGFPFREYQCAGTGEVVHGDDLCDLCEPMMPRAQDLIPQLRDLRVSFKLLVMPRSVVCVTEGGEHMEPFDSMELSMSDLWLASRRP